MRSQSGRTSALRRNSRMDHLAVSIIFGTSSSAPKGEVAQFAGEASLQEKGCGLQTCRWPHLACWQGLTSARGASLHEMVYGGPHLGTILHDVFVCFRGLFRHLFFGAQGESGPVCKGRQFAKKTWRFANLPVAARGVLVRAYVGAWREFAGNGAWRALPGQETLLRVVLAEMAFSIVLELAANLRANLAAKVLTHPCRRRFAPPGACEGRPNTSGPSFREARTAAWSRREGGILLPRCPDCRQGTFRHRRR